MVGPVFEARPAAKVNLTLAVLGRRPDGYHELRSVFLRVGLTDVLTVTPGSGDRDRLSLTGLPGAPSDGNLVLRALDAIRAQAGFDFPPLDVRLEKRIPVAAGLGGGSSDAAAALGLAQAAWGMALSPDELLQVAAGLGSDVPFFTCDLAAALIGGRGEIVQENPAPAENGVLLVTPPARLSTAAVFARYDELGGERGENRDSNQLWAAAASLQPALADLRDSLERASDRPWLLSGSGPTLFALYPSVEDAARSGRSVSEIIGPADVLIHAVDLVGPDPAWRHP